MPTAETWLSTPCFWVKNVAKYCNCAAELPETCQESATSFCPAMWCQLCKWIALLHSSLTTSHRWDYISVLSGFITFVYLFVCCCLFICVLLFGSGFITFVYLSVCCCFTHNDVTYYHIYAMCLFEWQGGETWMPDAYTLLNQQHRESKRSERPGGFLLKVDVHVFRINRRVIHTPFFSSFCVCVCACVFYNCIIRKDVLFKLICLFPS